MDRTTDLAAQAAANDWTAAELTDAATHAGLDVATTLAAAYEALRLARPFKPGTAKTSHTDAVLQYRGAGGKASERRITIHGLLTSHGPDGRSRIHAITAYCHQAKAPRTFTIDGVVSLADPETGAVHADAGAWLQGLIAP